MKFYLRIRCRFIKWYCCDPFCWDRQRKLTVRTMPDSAVPKLGMFSNLRDLKSLD
jgi:hypothetical protein